MKNIVVTITIILLSAISLQAQTKGIEKVVYECNFDCPSCEEKVMKNIPYEKGIKNVLVDYKQKLVTIDYKQGKNSPEGLQKALEGLGYQADFKGTAVTFGVKGACGMCKTRIQEAAKSVEGVTLASWSEDTQSATVTFNTKTNANEIQKAIAAVGHDTETHKADDEVYNNLHSCCKYQR